MNDKTTEIMKIMLEITQLQREIAAKNTETVNSVNKVLTLLADS